MKKNYEIFYDDCKEVIKRIPSESIDLLLQDPPYGVTKNKWDQAPDLNEMWPQWERVTKKAGAMIFFANQPFASKLISSNLKSFRYDLIWYKPNGTGFLNANRMPLRNHEHILVFYRKSPVYNPQCEKGIKRIKGSSHSSKRTNSNNYGSFDDLEQRVYSDRMPQSVLEFSNASRGKNNLHPTQKPLELFKYLIKTYTRPNDLVFDGYAGSGTTLIASLIEGRNCIVAENNEQYYNSIIKRVQEYEFSNGMFNVNK